MSMLPPQSLLQFPMGPHLRAYLGIADAAYRGGVAPERDDTAVAALTAHLRTLHDAAQLLAPAVVVDLLDELITMDLPEAALDLAQRRPDALSPTDFRAQLAVGVAAMLLGDFPIAEARLRTAQEALPEEPAPYVNLVQIYLRQGRAQEAEIWALAGLDAEPNHVGLWDLLASAQEEQHGEFMSDTLMALAEKRCSWAGLSLAANLTTTGDRYLKATLLERLYHQGEREPQFLVELTGAYGIAGDFAKIPPAVWQAERLATKGLPWQLHVHCAQAQIALGLYAEATARLAVARRDVDLPPVALEALAELAQEIAEAAQLAADGAPQQIH